MNAVIASGSRNWVDKTSIEIRLRRYASAPTLLLHGQCEGADMIAAGIGRQLGFCVVPVPYFDWLGVEGGPERNKVMIHMLKALRADGHSTSVEAFVLPECRGTADLIKRARRAQFDLYIEERGDQSE